MNTPESAQATALTPAVFLALSSGLTGVSTAQLQPAGASLDAAGKFHAAVCENLPPDTLNRLAQTFLAAVSVTEGAAEVLVDGELGAVGRSIIRLWLTGVWHAPHAPESSQRVVCEQDYRQSSMWRILQAHPMNDQLFQTGR